LLEHVQEQVPRFTRREFQMRQLPELYLPGGTLRGSMTVAVLKRPVVHNPLLRSLVGHTGEVWGVALSPDGSLAASASADKTVRLWDTASGQGLHTLIGHTRRHRLGTPAGSRSRSSTSTPC